MWKRERAEERRSKRFTKQQQGTGACVLVGPPPRLPRPSFATPFCGSARSIKLTWGPHAGITIAFALRGLVLECYHMTGGCGLEGLNVSLAA